MGPDPRSSSKRTAFRFPGGHARREDAVSTSTPPMAACVTAISSFASSSLTSSRITRCAGSAPRGLLAVFLWADTVRSGLRLLIPNYSRRSARRVPRSLRNRQEQPHLRSGPLGAVFGNPIDLRHWNQNSPFVLAKRNRTSIRTSGLSIYFNCGREDEFGFDKGALELHRQLQAEGIQHEFHLYPGNHGAEYFLAHLGETLQVHSRVFAAAK